jgi:hypothetical protein
MVQRDDLRDKQVIYRLLVLIVTAAVMQIVGAGVLDVVIAAIPIYGEMQVTIIGLAALFGVIYLIAVVAKWTLRRA